MGNPLARHLPCIRVFVLVPDFDLLVGAARSEPLPVVVVADVVNEILVIRMETRRLHFCFNYLYF